MSVLLLASLVVVAAAVFGSLVVLARSGETRVALLTGALSLLGLNQGLALWRGWDAPLRLDLATLAAGAGLAAGALSLLVVIAIARILRELERAETLHWESMEGVRGLTELAARRQTGIQEKLSPLLEMGRERLGLEIGIVSRVRGERYEVLAIRAPEDFPVRRGAAFALGQTYCRSTLSADRPIAIPRTADTHWADHPVHAALRFGAYLASAIHVGDEPFGTLVFASLKPQKERFTATHKDLLVLMAQWIGAELEREGLRRERKPTGSRPSPAPASPHPTPSRPGEAPAICALHLNAALQRLKRRIRRAVDPSIEVVLEPAPDLHPACELRIPFDAIVLSLARKAAEAMPEGGRLILATANHEPVRAEPGGAPAVAPDRYVTLSVSETGGAVDGDALAHLFTREEQRADTPGALEDASAPLPLSAVYRMLQRAGGDLSVKVEPGHGSTFTVFLPLAEGRARSPQAPRPSLAPAAPPAGH